MVVLALPISFSLFGFALGEGEKYLPNLFIITLFYTLFYFVTAQKKRSVELLDIAIILYLLFEIILSVLVSNFTANPGFWVKGYLILPLFYFMGKIFIASKHQSERNYKIFRNLLLIIGPYVVLFSLLEYFTRTSIHIALLTGFRNLVGSHVNLDPAQRLAAHIQGGIRLGFYRLLGPQVESTETALVACISGAVYLSWINISSVFYKVTKTIGLLGLVIVIVLTGTRTVIAIVPLVFIAREILDQTKKKWLLYFISLLSLVLVYIILVDWEGLPSLVLRSISGTSYYSSRLSDLSFLDRLYVWKNAFILIKRNMFFGVGLGKPVYLLGGNSSIYTTHNFYLDLLLLQGIIGSVLWLGLFIILTRRSFLIKRKLSKSVLTRAALVHLLLTIIFLFFGLGSPEKIQLSSLWWFYGGMVSYSMHKFGVYDE